MSKEELFGRLCDAVVNMDVDTVRETADAVVAAGIPADEAISQGLSQGMKKMGELWQRMEIFMPEIMVAVDAYYEGLRVLTPHLPESGQETIATIVMGTIYGDVHTVGKDVAIPVFRGEGFKVIDLGIDVPTEKYIEAIKEHDADIVGLGTYMSETFLHTKEVVQALKEAGMRDKVIIVCGGPATDDEIAKKMGADGAYNDAWKAVAGMKQFLTKRFS